MRSRCPYCSRWVVQAGNLTGPNFCPDCRKLFYPSVPTDIPSWIWGVLLVLLVSLHLGI